MSQRIEIPFCGPWGESVSKILSPEDCINLFPRPYAKATGADGMALFGTPGLEPWVTPGLSQGVRGILKYGNYIYVVAGSGFYRIDKDGNSTEIDTGLFGGTGPVSMDTNGLDIVIVDGIKGHCYDFTTATISEITDADFPVSDVVVHIDGYYLVNRQGTGQVYRSDYQSGSSWGGLAFSTAGANPDNVVSLLVDHNDVYVFGEVTTEIWYNTGSATFNFARIPGAIIDQGINATHAVCRINNAVYSLGLDQFGQGQVFEAVGRQPRVISTQEVSEELETYTLTDAFLWSYQQQGHSFVVCQFPTSESTLVYDSSTKLWHRRSSRVNGLDVRWRGQCHALLKGEHIVGDDSNGKLYKMKTDVYTDNEGDMIATRASRVLRDLQDRITIDEFQLYNEPGVGTSGGDSQDSDPQAIFDWSTDGGRTWSNEHDIPLGKIGEYENRANWHQLGQGRNWVLRVRISAAVKRIILGAYVEFEKDDTGD